LPIASITYSHNLVSSFLWNLLPENPNILQRWGQQFHVSAAGPFKLLRFVGVVTKTATRILTLPELLRLRIAHWIFAAGHTGG